MLAVFTFVVVVVLLRGSREVVYKRLKTKLRQECISAEPTAPWDLKNQIQVNPYSLDYLCVLDFEATCEEPNPPDYIHEIIEFPVVLLNLRTLEVVSEWKDVALKDKLVLFSLYLYNHYRKRLFRY